VNKKEQSDKICRRSESIDSDLRQKRRHLTPGSYAASLLVEIGDKLLGLCEGMEYPNIAAFQGIEGVREFKRTQYCRERQKALHQLKKRRYLESQKIGDKFMGKMCEDGFFEYFYQKVMKAGVLPDGQSCIVVFDVPEDRRDVRQQIRRLLKQSGFVSIQRSVWASPFDAAKELSRFLEFKNRRKWVRIYTAIESD